ncbi:hypothetical protein TrST_g8871 [Triparma strigata]|uniref:DOT1 domain-containing protein n=1 Tax=Triparma strigata TaxID=1606541 RepID=A0A9W6ZH07_9STRA|nr:hypothetical protein TrST_g8871 [Triparma strigata]
MPAAAARLLVQALSGPTSSSSSSLTPLITELWQKLRLSNLAYESERSEYETRVPLPEQTTAQVESNDEFTRVYTPTSSFRSSVSNRLQSDESAGEDAAQLHLQETTHGEIPFDSMRSIFSDLKFFGHPTSKLPRGHFVDLGSGVGRPVIAASLLEKENFSKCIGVELLADLHGEATAASQLLVVAEDDRVSFINGGIMEKHNVRVWASTDTSVLLIHGHCFGDDLISNISQEISSLAPGSFVVSTSSPLRSPSLQLLGVRYIETSWGPCSLHYQQRINSTLNQLSDDNTADQRLVRESGVFEGVVDLLGGGGEQKREELEVAAALMVAFASASEESARRMNDLGASGRLLEVLMMDGVSVRQKAASLAALSALAGTNAIAVEIGERLEELVNSLSVVEQNLVGATVNLISVIYMSNQAKFKSKIRLESIENLEGQGYDVAEELLVYLREEDHD